MSSATVTEGTALARSNPARIAAVHATGLLDSEVEEVFDRLTRLAVRLLKVPASFISLVDADRDFYKSACGFGHPLATMRELSGPTFCHFTVQRTTPLVIPDTSADPAYRDVPTVRSLGVAAYVGVPLLVDGQAIGAFCTIDTKPRDWTPDEIEVLVELAASAQREVELRAAVAVAHRAADAAERSREELARNNRVLLSQTVQLAMQAESLRATTAHLEVRSAEAEAANVAKSGFLSMMSHELRTPLNAISGYAELLGMGVRGEVTPDQADYLARIQRASRHLQTLIGDILDFTNIEAGRTQYELTDVNVDDVMEESAELLAPQVAECGISFTRTACTGGTSGTACLAHADRKKLRQILVNLLANAIKFTPTTGHVSLGATASGGRVKIHVTDTGRGIPEYALATIFDPFVQVDRDGTEARYQGIGLGLSICRELARGMHGELTVVSEKGTGSTFTVELPTA